MNSIQLLLRTVCITRDLLWQRIFDILCIYDITINDWHQYLNYVFFVFKTRLSNSDNIIMSTQKSSWVITDTIWKVWRDEHNKLYYLILDTTFFICTCAFL